jgi:broad specificity phosphatase PhoE
VRTLIVARHAFGYSNDGALASSAVPGEGLTDRGREQARQLGRQLAPEPIDLGVATRLRRTQETVELALEGRNVPVAIVPELDEIHFGRYDGGLLDAYREWAWRETPLEPAPGGGESRSAAASRYARGLRGLLARGEETVLLVGHALMLRYLLDAAAGLPPAARMAPIEHATPERLGATDVEAAAGLLEEWSAAPRFREL